MDCVAQSDGRLQPYVGGSPFNLARAAAMLGARVGYLNPLSTDQFGDQLAKQLEVAGTTMLTARSRLPTSLAVVQINSGQPTYGFYREGVADRDYSAQQIIKMLNEAPAPGVLHTGSLALVPPEHEKVLSILSAAKERGWIVSVDVNLRPRLAAKLLNYVEAVTKVIAFADWLKASDEDLVALGFEDPVLANAATIEQELAKHTPRVALTFGEHGAYLRVNDRSESQPVPKVEIIDTVGAGDTFWAYCLADWTVDTSSASARVQQTLRGAMVAAAINCTRAGCQPPTQTELIAALSR